MDQELEQYYNEVYTKPIKECFDNPYYHDNYDKLPAHIQEMIKIKPFSELPDDEKKAIRNSRGFAGWKFGKSVDLFKSAVKKKFFPNLQ